MAASHSRRTRSAGERGEVSSWLILAAGLALAATLGASSLQTIVGELVGRVATAAGVQVSAGAAADGPRAPGDSDSGGSVNDEDVEPGGGSPIRDLPYVSDGSDPNSSVEVADAALGEVQEILNAGSDDRVNEGEMDDIHDYLEGLTPEELAHVFSNLNDDQIQALFNGIDQGGWAPWHGWNDDEKAAFYETLAPLADSPLALLRLENALPAEDYLDFLVTVDTDHMNGEWPDGAAADALIREFIDADYLEGALDDGRQAQGNLAIVDDHNFELAYATYTAQRDPDNQTPDRWMDLNGFVDHNGRQWVRASEANAGTPIHEAIHNYSEPALKNDVAQPLNEGVTEYFSHLVIENTDDPSTPGTDEGAHTIGERGGIYPENLTFTEALVDLVGEDVVAAAYFDGDIDGLEQAYIDETGRTAEDWDTMIGHINNKNADDQRRPEWNEATDLLTEVPSP